MSWSTSIPKCTKASFNAVVDRLEPDQGFPLAGVTETQAAYAQFELGKKVAKELAVVIPGPCLFGFISGHANGVGYQQKGGMATDSITVSITQDVNMEIELQVKETNE